MCYKASAAALSTSSSNTLPCSGHFQWKCNSKVTVETSPGEKTSPQRSLKIIFHLRNQQRESHYLSLDHSRIHCFVAQVNSGSVSPGLLSSCSHLDGPEELLFGYRGRLFACRDKTEKFIPLFPVPESQILYLSLRSTERNCFIP